jgi:hypothetical protein
MSRVLASALLRVAMRALPRIPLDERTPALSAIDAFVAAPGPARFLTAARLLDEGRRAARVARLGVALQGRSFSHGLQRVRGLSFLDEELGEALSALPVDPRAGRRLEALAALLEAHDELAARVRKAVESRRPIFLRWEPEAQQPVTAFHRVRRSARPKRTRR